MKVFVVGSGASLLKEDLSLLDSELVFGVGEQLSIWKDNPLKFSYYGFHAIEEVRPRLQWAENLDCPIFVGWQDGDKAGYPAMFVPNFWRMVHRDHMRPLHDGNIGDIENLKWVANSVSVGLAIGVQAALHLGATEIYLLGHDFNPHGYISNIHAPRGGDASERNAMSWMPGGKNNINVNKALTTLLTYCTERGIVFANATCDSAETVLRKVRLVDVTIKEEADDLHPRTP